MSIGGRLSITKKPRSSSTCAASDLPAPDMPVMIVTSSGASAVLLIYHHRRTPAGRVVSLGRVETVQPPVHRRPYCIRQPGEREEVFLGQFAQLLDPAQLAHQAGLPSGAEAGHAV